MEIVISMIKQHLENAVNNLLNEKQREVEVARQRAINEKVAPYMREIDTARQKAIEELEAEKNRKIAVLQEQFNAQKQDLINKGEHKKQEFLETTVATETSIIVAKYDDIIKSLQEQITKIGE